MKFLYLAYTATWTIHVLYLLYLQRAATNVCARSGKSWRSLERLATIAAHSESLRFPFLLPPQPGKTVEIAPGVHWLLTLLPFRLNAVNLWLLRDG